MAVTSSNVTAITFTVPIRSLNALKSTGDSTLKTDDGTTCCIMHDSDEIKGAYTWRCEAPFRYRIRFYDAALSSFRTFRITTR